MSLLKFIFQKKTSQKDIVVKLQRDCNKSYFDFISHISKAHFREYYFFKLEMKESFNILKTHLDNETSIEKQIVLLENFKEKVDYINKNPFCHGNEYQQFSYKHLPLFEKTENFIANL